MKSKQTLADDNRSVSVITSLKIHGQPWSQAVYNSGKASVQARLILLEVIKIFAENNWRLACNVNLESTADTLVFQWCPNLDMDEFRFCAISLNRYDRLAWIQNLLNICRFNFSSKTQTATGAYSNRTGRCYQRSGDKTLVSWSPEDSRLSWNCGTEAGRMSVVGGQ